MPDLTSPPPPIFLPHRLIPGWLGEDLAGELLAHALMNEARFAPSSVKSGALGERVDTAVRQSLRLKDIGPHTQGLKAAVRKILPSFEDDLCRLPSGPEDVEIEMAAHGDGAHFQPHRDTAAGAGTGGRRVRRLSLVYYLNRRPKRFGGGALRFYSMGSDETHDVQPEHDLLVAFPSWAEHSVEPVSVPTHAFADNRFAINIWVFG